MDIGQAEGRVGGHRDGAALRAKVPSLIPVLLNRPTNSAPFVILTFSDFHKIKAFTGPPRIGSARTAMTITHLFRGAGDLDLDRSTETASRMYVGHGVSPLSW